MPMTEAEKQAEYLAADWLHDAVWRWGAWHPPHADWDHDHCLFCNVRISDLPESTDALRECWKSEPTDPDSSYDAVCDACFQELREVFRWVLKNKKDRQVLSTVILTH